LIAHIAWVLWRSGVPFDMNASRAKLGMHPDFNWNWPPLPGLPPSGNAVEETANIDSLNLEYDVKFSVSEKATVRVTD
jgi:hypothetical protein